MYTPRQIPVGGNLEELKQWLAVELGNIQTEQNAALDCLRLKTLYAEPKKFGQGMQVIADGTQWNPGAGQGVYTYYAGSWKKLG